MLISRTRSIVFFGALGLALQSFAQEPLDKPKTIEPRIDKPKTIEPRIDKPKPVEPKVGKSKPTTANPSPAVPNPHEPPNIPVPEIEVPFVPKAEVKAETPIRIPDALKAHLKSAPLVGEEGKSTSCVLIFDERCFTSRTALRNYLIESLRAARKNPSIAWTEVEADVFDEKQEELVKKRLFKFEGRTFSEVGLDKVLIEAYHAEVKNAPKPELVQPPAPPTPPVTDEVPANPPKQEPKPEDDDDAYTDFAKQEQRTVGILRSKRPMFLSAHAYAQAGKFGPKGRMEFPDQRNHLLNELLNTQDYKPAEVCLFVEELNKSLPAELRTKLAEKKDLQTLEPYLLVDLDGRIDLNSLRVEAGSKGPQLCYQMARGVYYVRRDDVPAVTEHYNKVFEGFKGLPTVAEPHRAELQELWKKGHSDLERVMAIEKFWRTKVSYLLDDHALYEEFFAKNPSANLVSAACSLGKGRCVPKNFGLAVAIHELSDGKIAVRMDSGYALDRSEEEERPIETHTRHLGIRVLLIDEKSGNASWKTFEASVGTESTEEMEKAQATNAEIFKLFREKLGAKKALRIPMTFTQLAEITTHITSNQDVPDSEFVTKWESKPVEKPTSLSRVLYFRENAKGEMEIGQEAHVGDLVTPQVIPKTTLSELLGAEKYLAAFMGNASYANDKSFGRTWVHLGGQRYQDTRLLKLFLPDGSALEEMHVYVINFASPSLLERVQVFEGGVKVGEGVVK